MFAWPVHIPPPRRRVIRRGGIRRPQAQSLMDHPLFQSGRNPPDCRLRASLPHRSSSDARSAHSRPPPPHRSITSGCPLPTGANFPRFTLLLGGGRHKSDTSKAYMLNFTYEDDTKIKNKHVTGISRTYYISIQSISRPTQSRETIPLSFHIQYFCITLK
jgi:hypothetical protein